MPAELPPKMRASSIVSASSSAAASSACWADPRPGQAAIAVAREGDQDRVEEILFNNGGEVVSVSVTDDLKSALDGEAPAGVAVAEDGGSVETA